MPDQQAHLLRELTDALRLTHRALTCDGLYPVEDGVKAVDETAEAQWQRAVATAERLLERAEARNPRAGRPDRRQAG